MPAYGIGGRDNIENQEIRGKDNYPESARTTVLFRYTVRMELPHTRTAGPFYAEEEEEVEEEE